MALEKKHLPLRQKGSINKTLERMNSQLSDPTVFNDCFLSLSPTVCLDAVHSYYSFQIVHKQSRPLQLTWSLLSELIEKLFVFGGIKLSVVSCIFFLSLPLFSY